MNQAVRRNTLWWGLGTSGAAVVAVQPDLLPELVDGEVTKKLWWLLLVALFSFMGLILDAGELGRHTRHRTRVTNEIATSLLGYACSNDRCPERDNPHVSIVNAAMD